MSIGKALIAAGVLLVGLGILVTFGERLPLRFGRLPGDIVIRGKNSVFYFPVVNCLLISAILSALMWIIGRR